MAEFICPCCGSIGSRPDVQALQHANVRGLARKAIAVLLRAYPRTMSMRQLADLVYSDDPTGGPNDPENSLASTFSQSRHELAKSGWRIGSRDRDRRGYEIGLWPTERLDG